MAQGAFVFSGSRLPLDAIHLYGDSLLDPVDYHLWSHEMKIVFFDGYCSLCNSLVDWLIRIDNTNQLNFASLQGETAAKRLGQQGKPIDVDTVVYVRCGARSEQSTAVLNILSDVGGFWGLARIFWIVPKFIRDLAYRVIAKNRYRFIKKRQTCRMPTQSERGRLLS